MAKQQNKEKLNVKKTIFTGFGFLATSIAWAIYDPYITKILNKILSESEFITNLSASLAKAIPWIGDFADPLAFLELFRGNSTLNVTNWSNPDFDALLNEAALYTNEKHNSLLGQAEQLLLDEAVILPVQHPVSLNVIDLNAVGGWAPNSFDIHPLKYLFKKETKPDVPNVVMLR